MIRGLSTETNARIRKTSLTRENGIDYSKRSLTRFMQIKASFPRLFLDQVEAKKRILLRGWQSC